MRRDDVPAVREADPCLLLAAYLAGHGLAPEQRRGDREVAAVGRDHGLRDRTHETDRRARGAKAGNLLVAVKVLSNAVADRLRRIAEDRIQSRDVIGDE